MKPRRLSTFLEFVLASPRPSPMLASVTHFTMFEFFSSLNDHPPHWLLQFPVLTHLMLNNGNESAPSARNILGMCKNLQVLICMHPEWMVDAREDIVSIDDDRLVHMRKQIVWEEDWVTGTKGGVDFWATAETFIAKKRRGEIEPNSRCWIEKEDGIGCECFIDDDDDF
ncbi:hypothetical protein B0H12DRAFT_519635 [Mycena haematopus]|nr:hypothetical protein B0H12DRAFT_519635 [Mycena haematopus]